MARTKTFDSQTIEGANFTLRVIGRQPRHRVELELADVRHQQRMLERERLALLPEDYSGRYEALVERIRQMTPEESAALDRIAGKIDLLFEDVQFAYLRAMLESFSIPGETDLKTVQDLLEYGPESFTAEVLAEAQKIWGFTPSESKNSSRPSTSPEPVDGPIQTSGSTAPTAENSVGTESETAS